MAMTRLSEGDAQTHIVHFGLDVYPPVNLSDERTRLHIFYEEARTKWPELFDTIQAGNQQFVIGRTFSPRGALPRPGQQGLPTFTLTHRGPSLAMPIRLPGVGATGVTEPMTRFREIYKLLSDTLPTHKTLRLGVVHEAHFVTGSVSCLPVLRLEPTFANAELKGGLIQGGYRDSVCNVVITIQPVVAVNPYPTNATVIQPKSDNALLVKADVNNSDPKPLSEGDINQILDRGHAIWPDEVLEFLNRRLVE